MDDQWNQNPTNPTPAADPAAQPEPAAPAWTPPVPEPAQGGQVPAADPAAQPEPAAPAWTPPVPEPSAGVETPAPEPVAPAAGGTDQSAV